MTTLYKTATLDIDTHQRARYAKSSEGVSVVMQERKDIEEIKEILGFNNTEPIALSPGDREDAEEKGDAFAEWYEEELREFYERGE
ncbi:hypothetical protein GA0061096_2681 [Fictibacillus enclensis]|uniref:Uncharacterized protein n=2 Tax=Fictibacillus enclensis TaxID=1017270 RepID=A0A0V8J8B5_9BACL|nr:hypothetical protein AS030_12740 [Fictibacillus enclensis]SCC15266.1 hypothetical protein GA0061096_2681 [Fictibacillus enclensis]